MKKLFAVLFAAMVLTACTSKEEAVVEEIVTSVETTAETTEKTTAETVKEYPLNLSADICLSELSFGMGMQEAEAAVNAKINDELINPYYSIYSDVSVDLDERLNSAQFSYGESGLYEVTLYGEAFHENDAFELRDKLMEQLGGIYGFAAEDWEIESEGFSNYCQNDDVSVFIRLYTADGAVSVTLMITSSEHRRFKDVEKRPVLQ